MSLHPAVVAALSSVIDPETGQSLVAMGLIRVITCTESGVGGSTDVQITMTTTVPGCPLSGVLSLAVETATRALAGVGKVEVKLTHTPPWSPAEVGNAVQFG